MFWKGNEIFIEIWRKSWNIQSIEQNKEREKRANKPIKNDRAIENVEQQLIVEKVIRNIIKNTL